MGQEYVCSEERWREVGGGACGEAGLGWGRRGWGWEAVKALDTRYDHSGREPSARQRRTHGLTIPPVAGQSLAGIASWAHCCLTPPHTAASPHHTQLRTAESWKHTRLHPRNLNGFISAPPQRTLPHSYNPAFFPECVARISCALPHLPVRIERGFKLRRARVLHGKHRIPQLEQGLPRVLQLLRSALTSSPAY